LPSRPVNAQDRSGTSRQNAVQSTATNTIEYRRRMMIATGLLEPSLTASVTRILMRPPTGYIELNSRSYGLFRRPRRICPSAGGDWAGGDRLGLNGSTSTRCQ
jgi:hypothetical protein